MLVDGVKQRSYEGTPQSGPLSLLQPNILLDGLDKHNEAAEHHFCRYCDDCNIYVRSKLTGERLMNWMRQYLEWELKLKVNDAKSAVPRPEQRSFLGFTFELGKRKVKIAGESWDRFQGRV